MRGKAALLGVLCVASVAGADGAPAAVPPTAIDPLAAAVSPRTSVVGDARIDVGAVTWATIPAGTFVMGCVPGDGECGSSELPRHPVRISRPYQLMTTEVTVGMVGRLANPPEQPDWNRDADRPVVNVTWGEASAFCAAVGGRLPTEAEWEYAARGGRDGDRLAWGGAVRPLVDGRPAANVADESARRIYPHMTVFVGYDDGYARTSPVGAYPPNAFGLYDMAGNVWEWVADWYDAGSYAASPRDDPKGPRSGDGRVVRGGSWYGSPESLRLSARGGDDPVRRPHGDGVGFRCARDVAP